MEKVLLKVETRKDTGKRIAKDLRLKGLIPAVVYKGGKEATNLQLVRKDLESVLHTGAGENVIITLEISGDSKAKSKTVLIKEMQRDPIKNLILHVDFNEISLTDTLKINVPLAVHGEAAGVVKDGGILEHIMWELHVECLPTNIPEKIEVDVSALNIGDSIFVKNIKLPEGIKVLNDPELIAIIVKPPKVEVPVEEAAEAAAEPELIRKKKEEGEEAEAEAKTEAKEPAKPAAKETK
ncbi:MAG: 50S ribosomal protein L25 [Candidatus Omnitrophota bacterium]|jgi:large subunit ribosomal protein L25